MDNYDVAQFILENGSDLKQELEPVAGKFYDLKPMFIEHREMLNAFNDKYEDFFCSLLVDKLVPMFYKLTYDDLRSMVTPDLVKELNGEDYFEFS